MNTTIIRVSAIISASVLLSVFLTQVNTSEATFLSFKKIQKPELTVYLSSASGTVNNAVVKASINNQIQTQTVTVSGSGSTPVQFIFNPVQRNLIDWFEVSVLNPRTGEMTSSPVLWWDLPGPSYGDVTVLNTG